MPLSQSSIIASKRFMTHIKALVAGISYATETEKIASLTDNEPIIYGGGHEGESKMTDPLHPDERPGRHGDEAERRI